MSGTSRRAARLPVIIVASLAMVVAAETVVLAATVVKTGKGVTAVKTVTSDEFASTDSTTYAGVPGMATTISVPADQNALLIITFSAETRCISYAPNPRGYCYVRVLVNGSPATPGEVVFDSQSDSGSSQLEYDWETNSMQFVAGPVTSGSHSVVVQYHTVNLEPAWAEGFALAKRTLTVLRSRV